MTTKQSFVRTLIVPLVALGIIAGAAGCSGNPQPQAASWSLDQQDAAECYSELNAADTAKLAEYAAKNGDEVKTYDDAGDTDTICVIDTGGGQHYVHRNDDANFLYYWMMARVMGYRGGNTMLTYGMLSGDLSPLQYMALTSLVGIDSSGRAYSPYTPVGGNQWLRQPTYKNYTVTNVYYGTSRTPVDFATAQKAPKAGYNTMPMPKASSDATGTIGKTGVIKVDTAKPASTYAKNNGVKAATPLSGSGSGYNAGTVGKPAAPKPAAPKPAAPKPAGKK